MHEILKQNTNVLVKLEFQEFRENVEILLFLSPSGLPFAQPNSFQLVSVFICFYRGIIFLISFDLKYVNNASKHT